MNIPYRTRQRLKRLVVAVFVIQILSQTGLVARVAYALGLLEDYAAFPQLLFTPSYLGTILAYLWKEIPFVAYFVLAFMSGISHTLGEAAENLGASPVKSFFQVTLPLSKSMLVYTVLTQFAWPWSDVLLPKLLLKDRNMWTVAVGLFNLPETHFARFAAGSVFIAIPIVILYFCLVKHIVNGLTAGSVKG